CPASAPATAAGMATRPGSPSASVNVATSACSASASSIRPRQPSARAAGAIDCTSPHRSPISWKRRRASRDRSSATVGRPVHMATLARRTPIMPLAHRSADSEPSRSTSDASCSASASWPWLNRTHASNPSAHDNPPQSPISAKTAADWLMRSSASSGWPRVKAIQARFCRAHASPRRSGIPWNVARACWIAASASSSSPLNMTVIPPPPHPAAPHRGRHAAGVPERAPLRHRLLIGRIRRDEIAFFLLAVGEHGQCLRGGDAITARTGGVEQFGDLLANAGEVALFDARLGPCEPQPGPDRVRSVVREDGEGLLVPALGARPRLYVLGVHRRLVQRVDRTGPEIRRDAVDPAELPHELGRDPEVMRDGVNGLVFAAASVGQPSPQSGMPPGPFRFRERAVGNFADELRLERELPVLEHQEVAIAER